MVHQQSLTPDAKTEGVEILLPRPTPNASWPQAGGYANHAMHHIQVSGDIREVWSISAGEGSSSSGRITSQPVIGGGRIFVLDAETELGAFDAKTGSEIWRVALMPKDEGDGLFGGGVAYDSGRIYVTTGFGRVFALEAASGKILWQRDLGAPMRTAPSVRGNRVFVITITNKFFALDGTGGQVLWTHAGIEEATNLLGGGAPAVDGGTVVVAYSSGEIVALRVETGQVLWSDSLSNARRIRGSITLAAIRGRPVIDRGLVFAISNSGLLAAINLRTGRRLWERNIGGVESPWIAGDYLFVLSNEFELIALNRRNGQVHWVTALPQWEDPKDKEGRINWIGPILASDRLILTNSIGEAYSISPYSGKILGKVGMPDGVNISPIIAQNTIYFLTDDAKLVAFR